MSFSDEQISDVVQTVGGSIVSLQKAIDMGASALWYGTKLGWPVFPLKARGKTPLTNRGFKDASCDKDVIEAWWRRHPDANIGVPTGPKTHGGCGLDVLDIDGVEGMEAWAALRHRDCPEGCSDEEFCPAPGPFDIVARAFTPGDGVDRAPGRHLYMPATGKGNGVKMFGQSFDWRGVGGYVVVPPSVGLSGVRYSWITRAVAS